MSTVTVKKPVAKRDGGSGTSGTVQGAPLLPQVNLLPDSVRADRALRRTKLWLLAAIGLVVILALLGYVAAMLTAQSAQSDLDLAQSEGDRLTREQTKYAEVPQILGELATTEGALQFGMSTDILWDEYVLQTITNLPLGAQLTSFETMMSSPLLPAGVPADPLTAPGIGSITMAHRSPTLPDTSAWVDAMNAIPGFSDARFSTATIAEEDGMVYYEVTTTVEVTSEALSGRFSDEEAAE